MKINKQVCNIDKKIREYFTRNYILNKRYFCVKSIMLIFGFFHKSRLLYGLPAFIEEKSWIEQNRKSNADKHKEIIKITNKN